ncbi:hypothetical protein ACU81Q_02665 [Komagataeibacter melomenusus]
MTHVFMAGQLNPHSSAMTPSAAPVRAAGEKTGFLFVEEPSIAQSHHVL